MFNFDGQLVADALYIQRLGDTLQGIRDQRASVRAADLQQDLLSVIGRYNQLHALYNRLRAEYNGLIKDNERVDAAHAEAIAEKDRKIARLGAENETLATEKEENRRSAYEGWTKLTRALEEVERLKLKSGEMSPPELKLDGEL